MGAFVLRWACLSLCAVLAGCGRVSFDTVTDAAPDALEPCTFGARVGAYGAGTGTVRATDTLYAVQARLCETDAANGYRDAIKDVYTTVTNCESSAVFYPPDGVKPATGTMNRLSVSN